MFVPTNTRKWKKQQHIQLKPTSFNESNQQLKQLNEEEMKINIDARMGIQISNLILPHYVDSIDLYSFHIDCMEYLSWFIHANSVGIYFVVDY